MKKEYLEKINYINNVEYLDNKAKNKLINLFKKKVKFDEFCKEFVLNKHKKQMEKILENLTYIEKKKFLEKLFKNVANYFFRKN